MDQKTRDWIAYLLLIVLIIVVFFYILKPTFTGMVIGSSDYSAEVDERILEEFEENESVKVIIILKDASQETVLASSASEEDISKTKNRIRENQDKVLSSIDYINYSSAKLNKSGKRNKITGWVVSDDVFEEEPDFKLKHQYHLLNALAGEISKKGLNKLRKNPNVDQILFDEPVYATLYESVPLINGTEVWDITFGGTRINGSGVTVCVIDTGVNYTIPAMGGCFGKGCKVINGTDLVNFDDDPADDHVTPQSSMHGTHVAGIVASAHSTYRGVAPGANIIAIKVLDSTGGGTLGTAAAGIDWCRTYADDYNISVITLSLGTSTAHYSDYCDGIYPLQSTAINNAIAAGIFVDISSGNEYQSSSISSPACIKNATAVGSTNKLDSISTYSNSDDTVDLLAPGESIWSLYNMTHVSQKSGTSMAAPHVAGAAALIYQYQKLYNGINATPAEVEKLLKKTGKPIYDSRNGLTFPRINVLAAINSIYKINITENSVADQEGNAKIVFKTTTNLAGVSGAFIMDYNFIGLDSVEYPEFNKPANLTLYNLSFSYMPVILKNGIICSSPQCNITSYNGNLTFSVAGFSNYSAGINSQLQIFDDVDNGTIKGMGDYVSFFANYTNITSGENISTAECNISFSDGANGTMSAQGALFVFSRRFTVADLYFYNVTCNHADFQELNATDDVTIEAVCINSTGGNVTQASPNNKWVIINDNVTCSNANLYFQNQTLIVGANTTFIMINSSFILDQSVSDQNIVVNETSRFVLNSSQIISKVSNDFYLNSYGLIEMNEAEFNGTNIYIYSAENNSLRDLISYNQIVFGGASVNNIVNLQAEEVVRFQGTSENTIKNSLFNNKTYFEASSKSVLYNSTFNDIFNLLGTAEVNFTKPQSNLTYAFSVNQAGSNPTLYGYVDMPQNPLYSYVAQTLTRYYPIQVNYTNSSPASNKLVNITLGPTELWSGYTNLDGFVNVRLRFSNLNYSDVYNVSVNPLQNISLSKDTPIQFILSGPDTTPPLLQLVNKTPNDIDTFIMFGSSLNLTYNITDDVGVNTSTIRLYFKTNSTTNDCSEYANGTFKECGYQMTTTAANTGADFWRFTQYDNQVYPGVYNWPNERELELTSHQSYALTSPNDLISIRFFNVSNTKEYTMFEVMVNNSDPTGTRSLRVYYCNSSYASGNVGTNPNCINFYNLPAQTPYNHQHSDYSKHVVIPFAVNTTTRQIGGIGVTQTSYFILRGDNGVHAWNAYYTTNVTRADTIQTSGNKGGSWSNLAGTVDAHLHQYDGSDTFYYYACANDTEGNGACSTLGLDLINLLGLPPTSPIVYQPVIGRYSGSRGISYTAVQSPNDYPIAHYNISLVNLNEVFVQTIISNNLLSLSYAWDTTTAADGTYIVSVEACDIYNQCSSGYSDNITIDNTPPTVNLEAPLNNTLSETSNDFVFDYNVTDIAGVPNCSLIINSQVNYTNYTITLNTTQSFEINNMANGNYMWEVSCTDASLPGNIGYSSTYNLTINLDYDAPDVTSISPSHNSMDNDGNVTFTYTVTDQTGIENCSLIIGGTINQTNLSVEMGVNQNFTLSNMSLGTYNWLVRCYDNSTSKYVGESALRTLNIAICGDNIITSPEQCDGSNLGSYTCASLGYDTGIPTCTGSCTISSAGCSNNDDDDSGGGGGGGGGGIIEGCLPNWDCSDWGECTDGLRTRTCIDTRDCDDETHMPIEELICGATPEDTNSPDVSGTSNAVESSEALFQTPGDSGVLHHCFNEIQDEDEEGTDCGGSECEKCPTLKYPALLGKVWILIPLLSLLLIYFIIPKRINFAEEDMVEQLIKENILKKYSKVHVTEKVYNQYKDDKKIKYLKFMKYNDKKDKGLIAYLKKEHNLNDNLAQVVALANRRFWTKVLTEKDISPKLKKELIRMKFYNPFVKEKSNKAKKKEDSIRTPEPVKKPVFIDKHHKKHKKEMAKLDREIEEISKKLEKI